MEMNCQFISIQGKFVTSQSASFSCADKRETHEIVRTLHHSVLRVDKIKEVYNKWSSWLSDKSSQEVQNVDLLTYQRL